LKGTRMEQTLFCPFTDKPCMGRSCACAVTTFATRGDGFAYAWKCGFIDADGVLEHCQIVDHDREATVDDMMEAMGDD